jgi:hypothetical protein
MAKALKIVGILLTVLVMSYLGAHYWIRWKNTVHDDVTKLSRLVECEPNEVRSITITQAAAGKQEELAFARVDQPQPGVPPAISFAEGEWRYLRPRQGEGDATLLRRIASTLCELYDPIPLRESEMAAAESNPERRAVKLSVVLAGKKGEETVSIDFGSVSADRMNTVRLGTKDGNRVVKIPNRFLHSASLSPDLFLGLQVMKNSGDNIQLATLKVDGKERFTLERAGADWKLVVNGKDNGAASEEANRFVNRLATLKALDVLEPAYEPERCRSMNAKAVVEMRGVAGREEALRFDYGRGGDIAACSTLRRSKFRVHRDLLKYLDVPARALAGK